MPAADQPDIVLRHIARLMNDLSDPLFSDLVALLPKKADAFRDLAPRRVPVLDCLDAALENAPPSGQDLLAYLAGNRNSLHWGQTYNENDFGAEFMQNYGYCEFVGLRGPIASERVACGVLFLGPSTDYPSHSHEAEEVYVPLSGAASWWMGGDTWKPRAPLEVIHHESWVPHAMRTDKEPLIALYLWRGGDLKQKSRID